MRGFKQAVRDNGGALAHDLEATSAFVKNIVKEPGRAKRNLVSLNSLTISSTA